MLADKTEALMRLRELLIKRNECKAITYRIDKHVETLVQEAQAKPQRRDDILREIEQNHTLVKQVLTDLEATQPQIERIIEILGEDVVLEEISKHPMDSVVSLH